MKQVFFALALCALCAVANAQQVAMISGKVARVSAPDMRVRAYVYSGVQSTELASAVVGADGAYTLYVPYTVEGEAVLDCGGWQTVNVWLCDEALTIDFEGGAAGDERTNIPIYVDQRGGRNAELMNMVNMGLYLNFSLEMGNGKAVYMGDALESMEAKQRLARTLNTVVSGATSDYMRFLASHYADRPAVMTALKRLGGERDDSLREATMRTLEASGAAGKAVVSEYRQRAENIRQLKARCVPGQDAPDLTFVTPDGKEHRLLEYLGDKVLVVDFWASWCSPCRKEIPAMKRIYEEFKGRGVEFLSLSMDSKENAWKGAMEEENMPWAQGWLKDAGAEAMRHYQFKGIPYIVVMDVKGKIFKVGVRGEGTRQAVREALGAVAD